MNVQQKEDFSIMEQDLSLQTLRERNNYDLIIHVLNYLLLLLHTNRFLI